jgi:membrane protein YdbS with pleckstrin-like domain
LSTDSKEYSGIVWTGRPWILPDALVRTILIFLVAAVVTWLETYLDAAFTVFLGLPFWAWTLLLFLVVWLISLFPLLVLKANHKYTLRSASLEVKTGIVSLKSFVLAPSGFSDLEINQSVIGRIVNLGDITVYTQSERKATMQKVRDPNKLVSLIRENMGNPVVRIEDEQSTR